MDTAQRAARAKALLEDPLLKEAFDVLENEQISKFTNLVCDAEQLMEAHRMVRALRLLKEQLTSVVIDGKLLERREEKRKQHRG
jgi:hypothetical protein